MLCLNSRICTCTDDLSKNKVASQLTTYAATSSDAFKYVAGNAVDRDLTTCMRAEPIGENSDYYQVWWKVDLGAVYNIYSVNILFKNYEGNGIVLLSILALYTLHYCI